MNVEIYTTAYCPYCTMAKEFLKMKGVSFKEIKVNLPEEREALVKKAQGRRTVPQIFINGESIGGYDDLVKNWHFLSREVS